MKLYSLMALIFLWGFTLTTSFAAEEPTPLLGDQSDGNRAVPVHVIPLKDETGQEISPQDELFVPFSTKQTCAVQCHSYETITTGWHFNAGQSDVPAGRPGHPWIYIDAKTGTQIPLSYRAWPGTHTPGEIGLKRWDFILRFGRHFPGGGIGEWDPSDDPGHMMRMMVSGNLEANCLACHDADPAHDQAEYARQIARQNFRWAAAATTGFTSVDGSAYQMPDTFDYLMPEGLTDPQKIPPTVTYHPNTFDPQKKVFFNLVRAVPNNRCYYCHSTSSLQPHRHEKWMADEDVHVGAGFQCVDCHRNGIDHNMVRGYEGESAHSRNPLADAFTCEGCHREQDNHATPRAGRFAAPVPQHKGMPLIHFEVLTCTACHAGSWPVSESHTVKTSLAHGLGTHNVNKSSEALPHIVTPVLAKQPDGKIAPHYLIWPAFWAVMNEDAVRPIPIEAVRKTVSLTATTDPLQSGDWIPMDKNSLQDYLSRFSSSNSIQGTPVYINGGKLHRLDENGNVTSSEHPAAQPYLWPLAHEVRPAAQSLGIRGCNDCHAADAAFFFGTVAVDSPLLSDTTSQRSMISFQGLNETRLRALNASFQFRPWFKTVSWVCTGILIAIVLIFVLKLFDRFLIGITAPKKQG